MTTNLNHFKTQKVSHNCTQDSPIKGDLLLMTLVLKSQLTQIAKDGIAATDKDEAFLHFTGLQIVTAITASVAVNLPVHLQRAFLEESGQTPEQAEKLLVKMRSEIHTIERDDGGVF